MTETELREECNLGPCELISTNLGVLDLMGVNDKNEAILGVVATGKIIREPVKSVIAKLKNFKEQTDEKKACKKNIKK
jgi:hypothetical protein